MKRYWIAAAAITLSFLFTSSAYPCSTPVFRYAMERWMADYYEGVLVHKGEIPDDDQAAELLQSEQAEFLNLRLSKISLSEDGQQKSDLRLGTSDLRPPASDLRLLTSDFKSQLGIEVPEKLPALVLWYPWHKGRGAPFWTGQFTLPAVKALIQSPKRKELAQRLMDGQTAVWLFVESGNTDRDRAALQLINQELETATQQLKKMAAEYSDEPGASPTLQSDGDGAPSFSYKFSTLTVSRTDPNEQMLLAMLLNSEPDLDQYAAEPIVFPVFGRGRALFALVGEGINADNLREAIAFITGPCGCEIKMMNPGVDLLMAVNWDAAVMQFYEEFYETQETLPELTSVFPEERPFASAQGEGGALGLQSEDGGQKTDDTSLVSRPSSLVSSPSSSRPSIDTLGVEDQGSRPEAQGLGVMGTTAVSVGAILVVVALGTFAVTRKHP